MQIYITANSPGELAGWVSPIVDKLKEKNPSAKVTLVITPCQYASGMEAKVATDLPGIDSVVRLGQLMKALFLHRGSFLPDTDEKRCVLFLGGDALYSVLLAKQLKAPLYGYLNKPRWPRHFTRYFISDAQLEQRFLDKGVAKQSVQVVGNLGLDSISITRSRREIFSRLTGSPEEQDIITFLPGSRPVEVEFMLSFFTRVAEILGEKFPQQAMFVALSPFADRDLVRRTLNADGTNATVDDDLTEITTASGRSIRIVSDSPHEVMSVSKMVLTIPGTNNLQIAAMGVPLMSVVPLSKAELIPLDGLPGLVNPRIYPFGMLKRKLIMKMNERLKFVSLPNMIANRPIVPELRGVFEPEYVAQQAIALLEDAAAREAMSRELLEVTSVRGAAGKIADSLLEC